MKRFVIACLAMFFMACSYGQVKQEVIASAGGNFSSVGDNLDISWTMGETIIVSYSSSDLIVTPGLMSQVVVTSVEENISLDYEVKVYPNPTTRAVTVGFTLPTEKEMKAYLFSSTGRLMKVETIGSMTNEYTINLEDVNPGLYLLKLVCDDFSNVYKIIKK